MIAYYALLVLFAYLFFVGHPGNKREAEQREKKSFDLSQPAT